MTTPKPFSFATMMVRAQRRHAARQVEQEAPALARQQQHREAAARQTLQKMYGTKRLLAFMYTA